MKDIELKGAFDFEKQMIIHAEKAREEQDINNRWSPEQIKTYNDTIVDGKKVLFSGEEYIVRKISNDNEFNSSGPYGWSQKKIEAYNNKTAQESPFTIQFVVMGRVFLVTLPPKIATDVEATIEELPTSEVILDKPLNRLKSA